MALSDKSGNGGCWLSHAKWTGGILATVAVIVLTINATFHGLQGQALAASATEAKALDVRVRDNEKNVAAMSAKLEAILDGLRRVERAVDGRKLP